MTREELDKILDGRRLVVSVSGGKDSTACCLHLMELGYEPHEYDRIFFDTGWEHPYLYEYIREDLPQVVGPIETLRAEIKIPEELEETAQEFERELGVDYSSMIRLVLKKGMFPSRVRRYCTQSLKVYPAADYLKARADGVVSVVGIRAEESAARSIMTEWEFSPAFDCDTWRPLIDWPVEEVIAIHQRHGIRPCRLYLEQNAERVGCYPCIFARKAEIRSISDYTPGRIDVLERLEDVVTQMAIKRAEARGKNSPPTLTHGFMTRPRDLTMKA
jgi:3'-phosphoadenosine 5'-phosphosulfate sulfotransferase (PAPS reductase)/FAD synthetase